MIPSRFLLGVDSDGTAFDSVNPKHLEAFIPAALEIWSMDGEVSEKFIEIYKEINLFSDLRGTNRFPALLETFERLEQCFPEDPELPDLQPLRDFVAGASRYSTSSLQEWMTKHPSSELSRVLAWSIRSNVLIARACEGLMPYDGVKDALKAAGKSAAVAVISAASREELEKDWVFGGLMRHVDILMGQEDGPKAEQLKKAMTLSGATQALMVGDANQDLVAAREADIRFYPIIPGKEAECWRQFREDVLPMFLEGNYGPAQEAEYTACLQEAVRQGNSPAEEGT